MKTFRRAYYLALLIALGVLIAVIIVALNMSTCASITNVDGSVETVCVK